MAQEPLLNLSFTIRSVLDLSVRITTVLEEKNPSSTVYRWYATSGENEPFDGVSTVVGDGLLTFDSTGNLIS